MQERVKYLGHHISHGKRELEKGSITSIAEVPRPRTKKELMRFLGMATYCRQWVVDYAIMTKELYVVVGKNQPNIIEWNEKMEECFTKLKAALSMAPALGLPDYEKPFFLYSHETKGFAQAELTQSHGDRQRPIAYFSRRLDPVEHGLPLCLQAVAAASYARQKL